jgi:predicted transcriptional regulator
MDTQQSIQGLMDLGLTRLEAEVYVALCRRSPQTGYRVSQDLGKPVANTYKAIESLVNKGAVVVDAGPSRLCRAVVPDEFLGRLRRRMAETTEGVAKALSQMGSAEADIRIYQLPTADQVLDRCRRMLAECREVALVDVFPAPLEQLRADLSVAAGRGVLVAVKVYAAAEIPGVDVILHPDGGATRKRWPGQWLNAVTDGAQHLQAFLTEDGRDVHQAVWSGSPYLSWIYHCAVSSEFIWSAVRPLVECGAPAKDIRKALRRYEALRTLEAPGYKALLKQFQGDLK